MQMRWPISMLTELFCDRLTNTRQNPLRFGLAITLLGASTALASCQTNALKSNTSELPEPGTFANPPKVGDQIASVVGSVVCFNELDAIGMVRTGFFTTSCESLTDGMDLVAEAVALQDAGEGPVLMVQTTLRNKMAWVPIPWHDWV